MQYPFLNVYFIDMYTYSFNMHLIINIYLKNLNICNLKSKIRYLNFRTLNLLEFHARRQSSDWNISGEYGKICMF